MEPIIARMSFDITYTAQASTGVLIIVALSILSLIAVVMLLLAIALSAWNTRKQEGPLFVRTHVSAYFLSLMLCWVFQSVGSVLNVEWVKSRAVHLGGVCVAQGVLKHMADVGAALWTFVIAAHTFACLGLGLKLSRYVLATVLSIGWILIALTVAVGPAFLDTKRRGSFYDVSGYWCFISPEYKLQSITLGYMIMFLSAVLSAVLYILTLFRIRGNAGLEKSFADSHTMVVAKRMLHHPVIYAILITPMALVQILTWTGVSVGVEWIVVSESIYTISGVVNAVLFTLTHRIIPFSSLRIGKFYLIPGSRGSTEDDAEKGMAKTVTFSPETTFARRPSTKTRVSKRPPQIAIPNRDSCSDIYTAREGVFMAPGLSSHWSPETPPLPSRMSVAFQNLSAIAHKI